MEKVFTELLKALEQNMSAELVTIIDHHGSTPRGAGARMLVLSDGSCAGTIGGGSVEYQAVKAAKEAIANRASFLREYALNRAGGGQMVCGGDVSVCFRYMDPAENGLKALVTDICNALDKNEDLWLGIKLCEGFPMAVYSESLGERGASLPNAVYDREHGAFVDISGRKQILHLQENGTDWYVEPVGKHGSVYVFGGGHVAEELVPLLSRVGFRVIVMDDRPEYANRTVFPEAAEVLAGEYDALNKYIDITGDDYVIVMTRNHEFDYVVLTQALSGKPCYLGLMGSRSKIGYITEKLLSDGFSKEEIDFIHMPIGVAIKAATPAEIAVSVAAELIKIRAELG